MTLTERELRAMYRSLQFVEELIDYIAEYPNDDYMTMECLCRKLFKYGLIDKKDGYYLVADGIKTDRKTENSSEIPNNCEDLQDWKDRMWAEAIVTEPQTDWHYDEQDATWYPYKHEDEPQQKSCATCKHALGNWDGESNNCGRCCGADRRFYEPKDEPQTERSSE